VPAQTPAAAGAPARKADAEEEATVRRLALPSGLKTDLLGSQEAWLEWYKTEGHANPKAAQLSHQHVPDSYADHYIAGMSQKDLAQRVAKLDKALQLEPHRPEAWQAMADALELQGQATTRAVHLAGWQQGAARFPAPVLTYAANQLATTAPKSILLVCSDADRWPLEMAQHQQHYANVVILPVAELQSASPLVRQRLQQAGIRLPSGMAPAAFCAWLQANHSSWQVFLAMDCAPQQYGLAQQAYLTGLAWRYSPTPLDNLSLLQHNWTHRLQVPTFSSNMGRVLQPQELRYLYPHLLLSRAYAQQGLQDAASYHHQQAELIARLANRPDLLNLLNR
jgi:tetratricopeptide (TPR) repeat protein